MDEYIKRQALLDAVPPTEEDKQISLYGAVADFIVMVNATPAADVAPVVHGSWDGSADGYADGELVYDMWNCSVCGFDADGADEKPAWKYCPNCGAKMDGR